MKRSRQLLASFFFLPYVYFRWKEFAPRPLWTDELEQLRTISGSPKTMLMNTLPSIPGGLPGDYLLTFGLAHLSQNKWVLAIPHALCMVGLYLLFVKLANEKISRAIPYGLALFFLSANKTLSFHALELRPYASIPLLALVAFYATRKAIQNTRPTPVASTSYVLGFLFILIYHAYGLLMLGGSLLYHLAHSRPTDPSRRWLFHTSGLVLGAVLLAIPFWKHFLQNDSVQPNTQTFEFISGSLLHRVKTVVALLDGSWYAHPFLPFVLLSFWPGCPERLPRFLFALFLVGLPILAILLLDVRTHYWLVQRQFVWTMPFWALFLGWSLQSLSGFPFPPRRKSPDFPAHCVDDTPPVC